MVFDNKKTTIRIYLWKMILAIITVILLVGIMVSGLFEKDILGIPKYRWVIIVTLIYLLMVVTSRMLLLNFFYFSDEGDRILIRYYPVHPLVQKKKAVQIPKIGLAGYEIKSSLFGLRKVLMLRQSVKGRAATYPSIGITALNRKEIDLLRKNLDRYVRP